MDNLPDVIIQHIQSLLETKEATQTMILSKSWLRAWSTRPVINFCCKDFSSQQSHADSILAKLIDKTLESYLEQGLPILELHLHVSRTQERWLHHQNNVRQLHLSSNYTWKTNFWTEIFLNKSLQVLGVYKRAWPLLLPPSAIIMCLNLSKLRLCSMKISYVTLHHIIRSCPLIQELLISDSRFFLESDPPPNDFIMLRGEGGFASLKKLSLTDIEINDDGLQTILSNTPQLENFVLIDCYTLVNPITLSSLSLQRATIVMVPSHIIIDAPNLQKLKYRPARIPFPVTITSPITKGLVKVTIIYSEVRFDDLWFHGLREFLSEFSKFSKLKLEFTLDFDYFYPSTFNKPRYRPPAFDLREAPPSPQLKVETLRFKEWFKHLPFLYALFAICHPKIVLLDRLVSERASLEKLYEDLSYGGNLECCKIGRNKCWRHYIKNAKLYRTVNNEQKPLDINNILDAGLANAEVITLALEWQSSDH